MSWDELELASESESLDLPVIADSFRRSEGPLAAWSQVLRETIANVRVDLPEGHPRVCFPGFHQKDYALSLRFRYMFE
jgi:hypothetical protein